MVGKDKKTSQRKRFIMKRLCENPTIVQLIDAPRIDDPYELLNEYIFPMLKIPGATEEAKTIICMKLDYPTVYRNDLLKNCALTFTVLSHVAHNTTTLTKDARTDLIVEELIEMFAFDSSEGFRWEPFADTEGAFNENWYARTVVFRALDLNGTDLERRYYA